VASLQAELAIVQAQLASRLAVAALQQQQQQQQQQQLHHHGGGGTSASSAYDQHGMPGPSSMAMATGSSSVEGYSNRVKEEEAYHHGMQHCYPGHQHQHQHHHSLEHLPSSPPEEPEDGNAQKTHSASMEHEQHGGEDVGDLQALAHALLCRK
jgi:hypothetical protein